MTIESKVDVNQFDLPLELNCLVYRKSHKL